MFSRECDVDTTLTGLYIMINDHIGSAASSNELVIVIDGMLWQNAAMNNPSDDDSLNLAIPRSAANPCHCCTST